MGRSTGAASRDDPPPTSFNNKFAGFFARSELRLDGMKQANTVASAGNAKIALHCRILHDEKDSSLTPLGMTTNSIGSSSRTK